MPLEPKGYREALEDVLKFSEGRRLLTQKEAMEYTGFKDRRTLRSRVTVKDNYVSATALALYMAG